MSLEAKHKALEDLAAAHVAFKEATLHLPADKLTVPMHGDWCVKDLIAHVSSLGELMSLDLRRIAVGQVPTVAAFKESEVDDWNAFLMRGRKLFPAAQVMAELESRYEMLVAALEVVPETMFSGGSMVANLLAIAIHHYGDHGGHIREWREKEGI